MAALLVGCGDGETSGGSGGGASASSGATSTSSSAVGTGGASGVGGGAASGQGGGGVAPSVGPVGCVSTTAPGHHVLGCDGGITYDLEVPAACALGGCGLVVDLHGYTMDADAEDENTGMRALGQQHGYVIVQPTAPVDALLQPSWSQPAHAPRVHAFVLDAIAALAIDPQRVHAMGFSQGGGMTQRLVCDHADVYASASPIAAIAGCAYSGSDEPAVEVDLLFVHGRRDGIVPFAAQAVPQRDAVLAAWDFGPPATLEESASHRARRWLTSSGTVLEHWEHDYEASGLAFGIPVAGHCVPGGDDIGGFPAGYSCEGSQAFSYGELAMAFFLAHPRR
jgi:poly(3-hydroxybutyrate) depolymerase